MTWFSVLLANLVAGVLVARLLGPERLGVYFLISMLPQVAFFFGNLGFGRALSFFVARRRASRSKLFRLAVLVSGSMSVVAALVLLLIRTRSFSPWRDIDLGFFLLFLAVVPVEFLTLYQQRLLTGSLKITPVNVSWVLKASSNLTLQFVFLALLGWGLWGASCAVVSSSVISFLYLLSQARGLLREPVEPDEHLEGRQLLRELWGYGRWAYLIGFVNYLFSQLPLFVLKRYFVNEVVAFFSVGRTLEQKTQQMMTPISSVLFPFTASSEEEDSIRRTNRICRLSFGLLLVLTTALVLVVKPLILFVYGRDYLPAVYVFYALAPGVPLWPFGQFLGIHITASGRPRVTVLANLGAVFTAVTSCAFLIPRYGAVGAAASISLIYATRAVFLLIAYRAVTRSRLLTVILPSRNDWVYGIHALTEQVLRLGRARRKT